MDKDTTFEKFEQGKKGAAKKNARGPVRSVNVEPVAGGYISTTRHHPAPGAREPYSFGDLEVTKHHKSAEDMVNHVSKMMGGPKMKPHEEDESDPAVGGTEPDEELGSEKAKKE